MSRGAFGSGSILRRKRPTSASALAVEQFERPVGDDLEDGVTAQDAARPADEQAQKPKLATGERNGFTRFTNKRAGAEIEDEPGKADRLHRFARRGRVGVRPFLRNVLHQRHPGDGK